MLGASGSPFPTQPASAGHSPRDGLCPRQRISHSLTGNASERVVYTQPMRRFVIGFALACLLCGIWGSTSNEANAHEPDALSSKDRIEVFETVWKTINDEYYDATFNAVNWPAARALYRDRVEAVTGDDELYAVISEMLLDLQ